MVLTKKTVFPPCSLQRLAAAEAAGSRGHRGGTRGFALYRTSETGRTEKRTEGSRPVSTLRDPKDGRCGLHFMPGSTGKTLTPSRSYV
jgi:hypothetical protein